jgi:hypothetical protein
MKFYALWWSEGIGIWSFSRSLSRRSQEHLSFFQETDAPMPKFATGMGLERFALLFPVLT